MKIKIKKIMKTDKKKDLNLPKTDFPPKANGYEREPQFNEFWKENNTFKNRSDSNTGPPFTLHDGPPYANGLLHLGHVLNKSLKDVVNKYYLMKGHKVKFKPGWDCHGLPTEMNVQKKHGVGLDTTDLRSKCYDEASYWMDEQREMFKRLGFMGDFDNPYYTMDKEYENNQLQAVYKLLMKEYLYRDERPVHYSPSSRTALAMAELEYMDREDISAYFSFVCDDFKLLCWTTMPWTLWGNSAVCVNEKFDYVLFRTTDNEKYVVEKSLLSKLEEKTNDKYVVEETLKGKDLVGLKYTNKLNDTTGVVVSDRFVTNESGTGLVHLCPGHGDEDFRVCRENGLDNDLLTKPNGRFKDDLPVGNLQVFGDGTEKTVEMMEETGMLFYQEKVTHSYPHDWRTKKPVYFAKSTQFFLDLKSNKEKLMKAFEEVDFSKEKFSKRFKSTLESREVWCVSRQRRWGFPLPLFFDTNDVPLYNQEVLEHLTSLFEEHGSNCWFDMDADELLPEEYRNKGYTKSNDTLDVWLESGLSWHNVLLQDDELNSQADLYFEGSDQHRGWFQSSFVTSVLLQGKAPYKKVLTHGFLVGEDGMKLSKSLGNAKEPGLLLKESNADVLKLWCVSVDYTSDVTVNETFLKQMVNSYFKLRNTFKYFLSNLYDYDYSYVPSDLSQKDEKALSLLETYKTEMHKEYMDYNFRKLFDLSMNFVSDLSKQYLDLDTKTVLYEGKHDSKERRNVQFVLNKCCLEMLKLLAPVCSYLCEDVWNYYGDKTTKSVFELEL